jgi:hypothetical protein
MKTLVMIPAFAAAIVFSATGMLAQEEPASSSSAAGQETRLAQVQAANFNWSEAHRCLDQDGSVTSLGVVGSMDTRRFKLPATAVGGSLGVRIVAHPIAGSEYVYPAFAVCSTKWSC